MPLLTPKPRKFARSEEPDPAQNLNAENDPHAHFAAMASGLG
jgi:hypothetical protein